MKLLPVFCLSFLLALGLSAQPGGQPEPEVIAAKVTEQQWSNVIEAIGDLRPNEFVSLTASVTDTISKISFTDGQRVVAGDILAEMTGDQESAELNDMLARSEEAKRQYDRIENLPRQGVVSDSIIDQRLREFQSAKAQLEASRSRLKDRLVIAPFAGVTGLRNISVGALVSPGDQITTLTDDSKLKLDFRVPSIYLQSLRPGLQVSAKTAAYPDMVFTGVVAGVDSQVDPVTRSIVVRVLLDNPELLLKPGLLMTVELSYNPHTALVIPEEALIPSGGSNNVLVLDSETLVVRQVAVIIADRRAGWVEIKSGLKAGQLVVTHGTLAAKPGQKVELKAIETAETSIAEILAGDRARPAINPNHKQLKPSDASS